MDNPQPAVAEQVRELYAEAQRALLMGDANRAVHLHGRARELERAASSSAAGA